MGDAESYQNVQINYISGRRAILKIYHNDIEHEIIELSPIETRQELHQLFVKKGFQLKSVNEIEQTKSKRKEQQDAEMKLKEQRKLERRKQNTIKTKFVNDVLGGVDSAGIISAPSSTNNRGYSQYSIEDKDKSNNRKKKPHRPSDYSGGTSYKEMHDHRNEYREQRREQHKENQRQMREQVTKELQEGEGRAHRREKFSRTKRAEQRRLQMEEQQRVINERLAEFKEKRKQRQQQYETPDVSIGVGEL